MGGMDSMREEGHLRSVRLAIRTVLCEKLAMIRNRVLIA